MAKAKAKTKANKMASRKAATAKKAATSKKLLIAKLWYLGLGLLVASAAVFSYLWVDKYYQSTSDLMPIKIVEIEGTLKHVTRDQIMAKLLKQTKVPASDDSASDTEVIGFFGSDLQILEEQLQTIAWLQKAELRRVWPDRLRIKIKEHKAIAHWNSNALINEFGEIFTPETIAGLEHLPSLTGPNQELQQLLLTFRELQQLFAPAELQLDVLNLNHRYSWSMELANGIQLQVGRKNLIQRVERFIALYPLLKSESDLPIAKIDLRYDTGLAVTRLSTSERQASL